MTSKRGLVLSPSGLQRLEEAKKEWERYRGRRCTHDELCELSGLSRTTISRILKGSEGVDRESIDRVFSALDLKSRSEDLRSQSLTLREDWGEAIDCSQFVGRKTEIETLRRWIRDERCRLITLLGMGGMGKTSLSIKVAEQLKENFEAICWRSLRSVPDINLFLSDVLTQVTGEQYSQSDASPMTLIHKLRERKILLVLDNVDSLLESNCAPGTFSSGYSSYRELITQLASIQHNSTIILTSRERLTDLTPLEGEKLPIRSLQIQPLTVGDAQAILRQKGINSEVEILQPLVEKYGGNPLCLKLVATTIYELYEGDIDLFLLQSGGLFDGIRTLLYSQLRRLTRLERSLMFWLSLHQEPTSLETLGHCLLPGLSHPSLLEVLESLTRRSLAERNSGPRFSQQTVVADFVIDTMVHQWWLELLGRGPIDILRSHSICSTNIPTHVQINHHKRILQHLSEILSQESRNQITHRFNEILESEREGAWNGYVVANIITLSISLNIPVSKLDLSSQHIRCLSLQSMDLANINMENCTFHQCNFAQPYAEILGLDWHPTKPIIAISGGEGDVILWPVKAGGFHILNRPHNSNVWCVRFSQSGLMMVTTSSDKSARVWLDFLSQDYKHLLHPKKVYWAEFSPDEQSIATACEDGFVRIWDFMSESILSSIGLSDNPIHCLVFSQDGRSLLAGSTDGNIFRYDISNATAARFSDGHDDRVECLDVSRKGMIASGCFGGKVNIWSKEGDLLRQINGHQDVILSIRFSPDGSTLATASRDRRIGLWDVESGDCKWFQEHGDWVRSVCFNPDGSSVVSGGDDQTLRIWDVSRGKCQRIVRGYANGIINLKAQDHLVVTGSADKQVRLWQIDQNGILGYTRSIGNTHTIGHAIALNRDGSLLAVNTHSGVIQVWGRQEDRIISQLIGHNHNVTSLEFDRDSLRLVSGDNQGWITLWDIQKSRCLWVSRLHTTWIWDLVYHPTDPLICSCSDDGTIRIWDYQGNCCFVLEDHGQPVTGLAFTPDHHLVSCSFDLTVRVWDLSAGSSTVLEGAKDVLWAVAIGPEGQIFAAGTDRQIHCWHQGEHHSWDAHDRAIYRLALSGDWLISASSDETVKVWDWRQQHLISTTQMPRIYENLNLRNARGLSPTDLYSLQRLGAII